MTVCLCSAPALEKYKAVFIKKIANNPQRTSCAYLNGNRFFISKLFSILIGNAIRHAP